jgi:methylthioribulose 1-phosphate dehydratase/enolase-phosphatase E1
VVPIIENTARECELTGRLREAIAAHPRSNAVLVRRHGIYVWGDSWLQVRTSAISLGLLYANEQAAK